MYSLKTHAKITLPEPDVESKHPLKSEKNHKKLLSYLRERLHEGKRHRDERICRLIRMDQKVAGWIRLSDADREVKLKAEANGIPSPTDINLPISFIHLDDMMTYFAQTFAPNRGMFYQIGKPDEAAAANQIVTLMNNHAIHAGYYRELLLAVWSLLKYNIGGLKVDWVEEIGPQLQEGAPVYVPVWAGNRIKALDMYNTMWDPLVNPTEVYKDGEFFAEAEVRSRYWIQARASEGKFFNVEKAFIDHQDGFGGCYYRSPPLEAQIGPEDSGRSGVDWVRFVSDSAPIMKDGGHELVTINIRLNPTEFGLIPGPAEEVALRSRYEIWQFVIMNDGHIIAANHQPNIHNYLPGFLGLVNDDLMEENQKSVGEILAPLQDFASHLLNTHMRANRKNIWGSTFYDSSVFDFDKIQPGEVNIRVPTKPQSAGRDLRQAVYHVDTQFDTSRTLSDLGGVLDLINQFFPTSIAPSQIGDIDRAVTSQVAAVQQGSNRRNHKTARLLDSVLFRPLRSALYYNIVQFQEDGKMVSDFYGRPVRVNLEELRATDLPFVIGQGLMMLDRQASATALQNVIMMLIQNPVAMQQLGVGMVGLLNYWVNLLDLDIDLTQFTGQGQQSAGPAEPAGPGAEGVAQAEMNQTEEQLMEQPLA